jgi:hypothetical protein
MNKTTFQLVSFCILLFWIYGTLFYVPIIISFVPIVVGVLMILYRNQLVGLLQSEFQKRKDIRIGFFRPWSLQPESRSMKIYFIFAGIFSLILGLVFFFTFESKLAVLCDEYQDNVGKEVNQADIDSIIESYESYHWARETERGYRIVDSDLRFFPFNKGVFWGPECLITIDTQSNNLKEIIYFWD